MRSEASGPGRDGGPPDAATASSRRVGFDDIRAALVDGVRDLVAAPTVSLSVALFYTLGGWLLAALLFQFRLTFLVYPLAMGFALVAPFVAVAFYEVSRTRAAGGRPTVAGAWRAVCNSRRREIRWMALITGFAFFLWLDIAAMVTLSFFGAAALDLAKLLEQITTTTHGLIFLVVGHLIGAAIALLIFSISVISIPMMFDRDVDVITAIATSVRHVRQSPLPFALWCAIIAVSIVASVGTALLLLPVVLPVLGYASWHLYRRAEPEPAAS